MNLKRLQLIFVFLFGVLFFSACSTKGQYDDFFNDKKGWIPVNKTITKELKQ